jgi:hypothetical protein
VIESMLGPIYFRMLMSGGQLDEEFVVGLAELVATGAGVSRRDAR